MKRKALLLVVVVLTAIVASPTAPVKAIVLEGGPGDDTVLGGPGADVLRGGGGTNHLFGKANPRPRIVNGRRVVPVDRIIGGASATADGGPGRDVVRLELGLAFDDDGTPGDNIVASWIYGADGARDVVKCVDHPLLSFTIAFVDMVDTVSGCGIVIRQSAGFIAGQLGATINIPFMGTAEGDTINGDNMGSFGSPIVFGKGGADTINLLDGGFAFGGAGVDSLQGSATSDTLFDGDGIAGDTLNGGGGADTIYAADGAIGTVDCGLNDSATDKVYADLEDDLVNCGSDTVREGTNIILAAA